ncbi:MAG TPA: NFACT RNA binding domain-containing protein, partial [Armatimonadota bacterium]|nr:NFACT RNA binding domain-containing protein [Armatimonadota bacterium]
MYYDSLTLGAVRDQIAAELVGGRVQRVVQPADLCIGLEIYSGQRHQLLISAHAETASVLISGQKPRRGVEVPSPLELLLRKYVRGARLEYAEQPDLERVLRLGFLGEEGRVVLVCEIMGRYSNTILLDGQGVIMDALKRIPPSLNRYRSILPRHDYVPPPAQDKADPRMLTASTLAEALDARDEPLLWRRLVQTVFGVSPIVAREMVYRATGRADAPTTRDPRRLAELVRAAHELFALPHSHAWEPCVASDDPEEGPPVAFASYPLRHYARWDPASTISEAIETVQAAREALDPYAEARARLRRLIAEQIDRQRGRLVSLRESLASEEEIADLQARGNAILSMVWAITPGQTEITVDPALLGRDACEALITIPLDPTLSAVDNAQALFRRRRKKQSAGAEVPGLIAQTELEMAYLSQLQTDVDLAVDRAALDQVEEALHDAGYLGTRPKKGRGAAGAQPLSIRLPEGMLALVGRSSRENDVVTFRLAGPHDIWLHAHGVPGAHVIIRTGGAAVRDDALLRAAQLAAHYSAARTADQVQVDYAERRHVRHIKGGRPGMVTYSNEQTLVVAPRPVGEEELG